MKLLIRRVTPEDAEALLDIYAYYVKYTAISFEYDVPEVDEFRRRIEEISPRYPYIIAETEGKIVGFAYAASFSDHSAYDWSAELTVYAHKDFQKCGIGGLLYSELEKALSKMGVTNLYARIAVPETEDKYLTDNSLEFHKHLGYSTVGRFHKCGYKFSTWYDMVYVEKIIGSHFTKQNDVTFFCDIK
ncbi:MAG: GNAT family N-acetyltransferase [Ruminococcus sp.]|nr:GNAT family N-acetyltransferase [Ruminococcus sp.]